MDQRRLDQSHKAAVEGELMRACPALIPPSGSWLDRVSKKPSVKADLAIYSYIVTTSG